MLLIAIHFAQKIQIFFKIYITVGGFAFCNSPIYVINIIIIENCV